MARKPDGVTLQRRVVRWALAAGRRVLPDYSHPKSPRTYTQPQLLACLVLRAYGKYTYRGVVEAIADGDALREELGLADGRVPRHTTLEEFASRADPRVVEQVVAEVLALDGRPVDDLAEDSTGLQAGGASLHYLSRTGKACAGYVKLSLAVACDTLMAVAAVASRGPTHDVVEARALDWLAASRCRPTRVYKDAGYDREWAHVFWRQGCGASSFIPPVARGGSGGAVRSRWRSEMARRGMPACYGRRWHVESFIAGLKRVTGDKLFARSDAARFTEAMLRLLAYQCRRA